jgi:hypothetical protein
MTRTVTTTGAAAGLHVQHEHLRLTEVHEVAAPAVAGCCQLLPVELPRY